MGRVIEDCGLWDPTNFHKLLFSQFLPIPRLAAYELGILAWLSFSLLEEILQAAARNAVCRMEASFTSTVYYVFYCCYVKRLPKKQRRKITWSRKYSSQLIGGCPTNMFSLTEIIIRNIPWNPGYTSGSMQHLIVWKWLLLQHLDVSWEGCVTRVSTSYLEILKKSCKWCNKRELVVYIFYHLWDLYVCHSFTLFFFYSASYIYLLGV